MAQMLTCVFLNVRTKYLECMVCGSCSGKVTLVINDFSSSKNVMNEIVTDCAIQISKSCYVENESNCQIK